MDNEEKILKILESMQSDIKEIKTDVKTLKDGQCRIEAKLEDLEPKNATRHTELLDKIDTLNKDVKFVKHKLHETEEDVFDIKDHLKIIK